MPEIGDLGSQLPDDLDTERRRLLQLLLDVEQRRRNSLEPIRAYSSRGDRVAASFAQERLWFLDRVGLVGAAYNVPLTIRLFGELSESALEQSFRAIIRRHETLRTTFSEQDGAPIQVIGSSSRLDLRRVDISHIEPVTVREESLRELMRSEQLQIFDLEKGPLLRVSLVTLGKREHMLLVTIHHIIVDGWSMELLLRELSASYRRYVAGEEVSVPALPIHYADYSIWQRERLQGTFLQEQLRYWKGQLEGAPAQLNLVTDRIRPQVESFRGAIVRFRLPEALVDGLRDLMTREESTLYMVMLAAFQILLSKWSGQQDVVIGSPIANRRNVELEDMLGFFANTLIMRSSVAPELPFYEFLQQVKETTLAAYEHQDLPFEILVRELRPERSLTRQPVFQVAMAVQNFPLERLALPGLTWQLEFPPWTTTHFDLMLHIQERENGIHGVFEFATGLFDEETIERMTKQFVVLLESVMANPDCPIARLNILDESERRGLEKLSGTLRQTTSDKCIHDLFVEQAARTPRSTAVTCGQAQISYADLDSKSDRLAALLESEGVVANDFVAICMDRSIDMIVAILGVLKAGAAYVPLDPNYPSGRLQYMLEDCRPKVLLTQGNLLECVTQSSITVIPIDGLKTIDSHGHRIRASRTSSPTDLAYVIYTSGSTGAPKGVMVEHRNVSRLFTATDEWFEFSSEDVWTLFHSISFDFSVWEIWGALLYGGRLVIVPRSTARSPLEFYELVCREAVTVLNQTPSAFTQFIQAQAATPMLHSSLRLIIFGGEKLDLRTLRPWIERNGADSPKLVNMYGITETTVHVTYCPITQSELDSGRNSPIGRPIPDLTIRILDQLQQPVPIGIVGEMQVGGAAVSRGYLNRPDLTAQRFIEETDAVGQKIRFYRTGDLGRWRPDGTIEYFGRNDSQVKLHGYRIELGEIEATLESHPGVKNAVAVIREDVPDEKQIVTYIVPAELAAAKLPSAADPAEIRREIVHNWTELYEETYGIAEPETGPTFVGWNSSYTGEAIPSEEMEEWLSCTIERIRAFNANRILEIGCGMGLLLQHLAPGAQLYVGTDISSAALERLGRWISAREDLSRVRLLHKSATELQDLEPNSFDLVVLNSVIQYFPDREYLEGVIRDAIRLVGPNGVIFIGDVRHLGLLALFHTSVELEKAAPSVHIDQLKRRIARSVAQDKELVVHPRFFGLLSRKFPQIQRVTIRLKEGRAENELTRFRFDVSIYVNGNSDTETLFDQVDWQDVGTLDVYAAHLAQRLWHAVRIQSIPNGRLVREAATQKLIDTVEPQLEIASLRRHLRELSPYAVDPQALIELARAHDYECSAVPGESTNFELQLVDCRRSPPVSSRSRGRDDAISLTELTNEPTENEVKLKLVPQLRNFLQGKLPEHMIPSGWVVLKKIPLTENGKLDRKGLPAPELGAYLSQEYEAPRGAMEQALASIWQELMQVDRVGRSDNFFELGGHSLLGLKLLAAINKKFGSDLRGLDLYKSPTISRLAELLMQGTAADDLVDLSSEAVLPADIVGGAVLGRSPESILLTGATGFVGRFLLCQLLRETDAVIYCLVRGASETQVRERLKETLIRWDLWNDEFEPRVLAIAGDLSGVRMGIDSVHYYNMCRVVDVIFNCGTSMNHLETYSMAKRANVEGIKELLRFAANQRTKVVHHISSLGVFGTVGLAGTRFVDEQTPIDDEKHLSSQGYLASKWVGEKLISLATERGIPCNIFRLGLVWADTAKGRYDDLQWAYRIIKSSLQSGFGIKNYRYGSPPTPVDYVARSIAYLSKEHRDGGATFHISSTKKMEEGLFERLNRVANTDLELLSMFEWIGEMKRLHESGISLSQVPLIEFAFNMDEQSFNRHQRDLHAADLQFRCAKTHRELELAGIVAPELSDELLRSCIKSMVQTDRDLRDREMNGRVRWV